MASKKEPGAERPPSQQRRALRHLPKPIKQQMMTDTQDGSEIKITTCTCWVKKRRIQSSVPTHKKKTCHGGIYAQPVTVFTGPKNKPDVPKEPKAPPRKTASVDAKGSDTKASKAGAKTGTKPADGADKRTTAKADPKSSAKTPASKTDLTKAGAPKATTQVVSDKKASEKYSAKATAPKPPPKASDTTEKRWPEAPAFAGSGSGHQLPRRRQDVADRLLQDPAFADTVVIINEYGEPYCRRLIMTMVKPDLRDAPWWFPDPHEHNCADWVACANANLQMLEVLQLLIDTEIARGLSCKKRLQKWGPAMAIFGYARVSTRDQDLSAQITELKRAGCTKVHSEKVSGARSDRPELGKVLGRLEAGDVLVVTRLDRLARSTRDLLNVIDAVAKRGAGFKSLKDTWADTTSPHGRLMLTVLGGLAESERELIRARTGEGRKRAKERGVRFGRPPKLTPHQRREALQRLAAGETQTDIARTFAVDPTTIGRLQ
jgi:DNA invertase Pin-like site-specific DNA recombinase